MLKFLSVLFLFSGSLVFAQSTEVLDVEEPPVVIEPEPELNVSYPFMSCKGPTEESDFSNVTLMVNATDPSTGMIVAIRNPLYDEDFLEVISEGVEGDFSSFILSPIQSTSNDLKITQLEEEGLFKISGGFIGFTELVEQTIDANQVQATLKLKDVFTGTSDIELECSMYSRVLENVFE